MIRARPDFCDLDRWNGGTAIAMTSVCAEVLEPDGFGPLISLIIGSDDAIDNFGEEVDDSAEDQEIDLGIVDDIINKEGRSREAAIPILQAIQTHYRYLPDEALKKVCEETEITPAQIAALPSSLTRIRSTASWSLVRPDA